MAFNFIRAKIVWQCIRMVLIYHVFEYGLKRINENGDINIICWVKFLDVEKKNDLKML